MTPPLKLFCSYSHQDEAHRERLEKHLALLKRQGLIEGSHDRKISAGTPWASAIDEHLEKADIILLLVSADFIASDYCVDREMKRALERDAAKEAVVIPIAVRPCDRSGAPFAELEGFPSDGKAVTEWSNRDKAWTDVAKGLRDAIERLRARRSGIAAHHASPP